ncbi:MAG: hypothetical protein AB7P23_03955 [Amphiplicatus sp.]
MTNAAKSLASSSALDDIKGRLNLKDPYDYDWADIEELQTEAAKDLFAQRRQQIRILDQRATEVGLKEIGTLGDLAPLLFADQTYKSYPEIFVKKNQWSLMNRWLDTLSTNRVGNIDVSDIKSADDWMKRLAEHGHRLVVSGGTSGKNSFLNRTPDDVRIACESVVNNLALTQGLTVGAKDRPLIILSPLNGNYIFVDLMRAVADSYARPGEAYWLSELPLTEADTQRQGELRRKAKDGTATPGELRELEEKAKARQAEMTKSIEALVKALIKHQHEPVMVIGLWYPLFLFMEEARRQGVKDGCLHPQSTIFPGGGLKGAKLPEDYKEQLERFFGVGPDRYYGNFGMVEMLTGFLECPEGRYHCPPWVKMLILDETGEHLLKVENGLVEGRLGFLDLMVEGRWGGIITGDKVTADYRPCGCGRKSPGLTSIMRYADLPGGDDKLSCAGTMSSYIRGEIS